jgi:F420H(2)-dependent quinone reductase
MPIEGDYEPSEWKWVADQVDRYESSGGTKGLTLQGKPVVILTMRGVQSGKVRKAGVMRVEHDGRYAAIASKGGDPRNPGWYYNLQADPTVVVQDGPEAYEMRAREVHGEERAEWWARGIEVWPQYDGYQAKTDREIPVFVLEPAAKA